MKKKVILFFFVLVFLGEMCSFSWAGEGKRLDLILKDGKVSADIRNASLGEVAGEIGKSLGLLVELYGGVDKDRKVSTKFENLPLLDSLYCLLRDTNFLYIVGERLYVLGFGKEIFKNGALEVTIGSPIVRGPSMGMGGILIPQPTKEGLEGRSTGIKMVSGIEEDSKRRSGSFIGRERSALNVGGSDSAGEIQNLGEIKRDKNGKDIIASLTTPIILDAQGQEVSALSSDITYDPTLLGNPKVVIGDSGRQAGKEVIFNEVRPGLLRVGVVGLNQNAIPDGAVVHITFDVLREGQISLRNQPTASDSHGNKVPVRIKDGKITTGNN